MIFLVTAVTFLFRNFDYIFVSQIHLFQKEELQELLPVTVNLQVKGKRNFVGINNSTDSSQSINF